MKKNISKVMALGVTVVTVVIAVLISVLLCANYYEQKNRKLIEDFVVHFTNVDTGRRRHVTLRDDEDGIVAHVVYVKDECLLLSNGQEAKTLKKISDGAVVPTNQEE